MLEMKTETPGLLSIGVPVYNAAGSIARTMDSILAQDYPSIEILVSDNGSTDGTSEILREYAARDARITLVRQAENRGIARNFQAVLDMARGEFFIFYASDDVWTPEAMSRLIAEFRAYPACGLVMSATRRVRPDGAPFDYIRYTGPYNPNDRPMAAQASLMATMHQTVLDHNLDLFAVGLYRRRLLASAYALDPRIWEAGVVALPAIMAIASGLRYLDEPFYVRTVQDRPFQERLPDDPLSSKMASLSYATLTWRLLRLVLLMPEIGWRRKLASFPVFPPLAYMAVRNMLGRFKRALLRLLKDGKQGGES